jgi:Ser/Thr protein kinase RdoA (MazF antagonist)
LLIGTPPAAVDASGARRARLGPPADVGETVGVRLDHLGTPLGAMDRLPGKASNRVYRLDTDEGSFAVKELDVAGRRWTSPVADVFRFERAAHAAGIPMPEPVSAGADVLVHRWVEGEPLRDRPVPAAFAFEVGEILARLHALHVDWTHETVDEPIPTDWPELERLLG